jgi:hypothetical protein
MKKRWKKRTTRTPRWRLIVVTMTLTEDSARTQEVDTIPMNKEERVWSEHFHLAHASY